jgi:hypothetical protein
MGSSFLEKALEIASRLTHPYSIAAFGLVFAAIGFWLALKSKKPRLAWLLGGGLLLLALAPLIASTYLATRGIYRIRLTVLGLNQVPDSRSEITSDAGGEISKSESGWEINITPQTAPPDRRVMLYASVKVAYLIGNTEMKLDQDYYPHATIVLHPMPTADVRGIVIDKEGHSVEGARVSVVGYPETVLTDAGGTFVLSAHASEGEPVTLRAEKGKLVAQRVAIGGRTAELTLRP